MSPRGNRSILTVMQVGGQETSRPGLKLRAKSARGEGFLALRLDGVIDEHNGLDQIGAALGGGNTLLVDLGGVKRLNSVGVRDWVNWLRTTRTKFREIVIFDCPPPVMNEVNFVKNFAEGAYITTFAAPLYCARCQKEESRLLDTVRIRNGSGGISLPSFACDRSDCENALDDDEETYFGFVPLLPATPDPERLLRLTEQARGLLASAGAAIALAPTALDAHANASPTRSQPLGGLGLGNAPRKSSDNLQSPQANTTAAASPSSAVTPPEREAGGDWLFIAAMAAMLAVLGVLIYLILTLE